jgi:cell division protein FtsW (lipid II flippase)
MELFDNLASVGLTTQVLQVVIVLGVVIFLIGLYWKYIVAGIGILFCVVVFATPNKKQEPVVVEVVKQIEVPVQQKQEEPKVQEIKPEPPVAEVKPQTEEEMFMSDCVKLTNYTKNQCATLWRDRENDLEPTKWRKKWKKDYMVKVKHVT